MNEINWANSWITVWSLSLKENKQSYITMVLHIFVIINYLNKRERAGNVYSDHSKSTGWEKPCKSHIPSSFPIKPLLSVLVLASGESGWGVAKRVGVLGGGVGNSPHVHCHLFSSVWDEPSINSAFCRSTSYSVSDLIGVGGRELEGLENKYVNIIQPQWYFIQKHLQQLLNLTE